MLLFSLLKKKHAFAYLLIGALGACGEDAPTPSKDEEEESVEDDDEKKDAGKDAGKDASSKRDARADDDKDEACSGRATKPCTDCDEEQCVQLCSGGKWGECSAVTDVVGSVLDGGLAGILGDAASVRATDAGVEVSFGDASVSLPTAECPTSTICASRGMGFAGMLLSSALMGASFCATEDAIGLPPACTALADCQKLGFGNTAMCYPLPGFGSYCIQFCK